MNKCIDCEKEITPGSKMGRCRSCARKYQYKNRPETHPMFGKIGNEAGNYKDGRWLKKYFCIECNKEISICSGFYNKGRCSSCGAKDRLKNPENHPNYKDGSSFEIYPAEFSEELKEFIRKRDNYTCQNCGMTEAEHLIVYGRVLDVHHIDYNKQNCKEDNLISTCIGCNIRANYNRDYWKEYYQKKVIMK